MNNLDFLSRKIARTMLHIGATTFRNEPYKWASGMEMHTYNDNRMMLANPTHRKRVTDGFIALMDQLNLNPNYIVGTSTAGIAPAASLAQRKKLPLIIRQKDEFYQFDENLCETNLLATLYGISFNTIVTTCPFAIPYGVQYANRMEKEFAYVREAVKDHGKEQQVEGNLKKEQKAVILHTGENVDHVVELLTQKGIEVCGVYDVTSFNVGHAKVINAYFAHKKGVAIEDLFSTGSSAAEEVYYIRNAGGNCDHCLSIFSYNFNVLKSQFSGEESIGNKGIKLRTPCRIYTLLPFSTLHEEMVRINFYTPDKREAMKKEIGNFDENYKSFLSATS